MAASGSGAANPQDNPKEHVAGDRKQPGSAQKKKKPTRNGNDKGTWAPTERTPRGHLWDSLTKKQHRPQVLPQHRVGVHVVVLYPQLCKQQFKEPVVSTSFPSCLFQGRIPSDGSCSLDFCNETCYDTSDWWMCDPTPELPGREVHPIHTDLRGSAYQVDVPPLCRCFLSQCSASPCPACVTVQDPSLCTAGPAQTSHPSYTHTAGWSPLKHP